MNSLSIFNNWPVSY